MRLCRTRLPRLHFNTGLTYRPREAVFFPYWIAETGQLLRCVQGIACSGEIKDHSLLPLFLFAYFAKGWYGRFCSANRNLSLYQPVRKQHFKDSRLPFKHYRILWPVIFSPVVEDGVFRRYIFQGKMLV